MNLCPCPPHDQPFSSNNKPDTLILAHITLAYALPIRINTHVLVFSLCKSQLFFRISSRRPADIDVHLAGLDELGWRVRTLDPFEAY